ncbi:hypothetical protein KGY79_13045 [Candidatus Bipolaricaulota bacterium]|nr:hypothetical protein [Candidatus Bipolaricaulota bacterium]
MKKYLVLGMALLMVLSVIVGVAAASDSQEDGTDDRSARNTNQKIFLPGDWGIQEPRPEDEMVK